MNVLPTAHDRMMRAQTKVIRRTFHDDNGAPVDLTRAIIDFAMRADIKIAPSVLLTSASVTFAELQTVGLGDGLVDTIIGARTSGDNASTIQLLGDGVAKAGSITDGSPGIVLHYLPGSSTVADMETLLGASSHVKVLVAGSTPTQVLDVGSAFAANPLVIPSTGYRTGIVINPDQNSFRGQYTITIVPTDTNGLVAMGDDDPWLHEAWIQFSALDRRPDYTVSRMGLYAQAVVIP